MTGAALRMTWHHFFVAGAVLYKGGVEKSQNALVRGCQLCTQLSKEVSQNSFVFDVFPTITLKYTTLHYITLHYTTFHYTSLH